MEDSSGLAFWQTLLAASAGSFLTVCGQGLVQWIQQRRYRENELWKRQIELINEYEDAVSRLVYDTSLGVIAMQDLSNPERASKINHVTDEFYRSGRIYSTVSGRYPSLVEETSKLVAVLRSFATTLDSGDEADITHKALEINRALKTFLRRTDDARKAA